MPSLPEDSLHECEGHYREYLGCSDESWITRRTPSRTAGGSCLVSLMTYPISRGPRSPLSPCRSSRGLIRAGQWILPHSGMNGIRPPVGARRCHGWGQGPTNEDRRDWRELKDMVQGWIDWENQLIRKVPQFLRDHWLRRIPFTTNEAGVPTCGIHNAEEISGPAEGTRSALHLQGVQRRRARSSLREKLLEREH